MDRETWVPSPGDWGGQEVWAEAVRATAWKRGPLLGWQVREAGVYPGGPFGDRGNLYKGQGRWVSALGGPALGLFFESFLEEQ